MAGLELKYEVVKECIHDIQQLPDRYPAAARPAASGRGQCIQEMEQLADLYESFYVQMIRLAEETAKYLNSMITDFRAADEKKEETANGLSTADYARMAAFGKDGYRTD